MSTTVELVRANERYARLRAAVEKLAGQRDVAYPERFQFDAADNHVAGYRAAQADLRALLAAVDS